MKFSLATKALVILPLVAALPTPEPSANIAVKRQTIPFPTPKFLARVCLEQKLEACIPLFGSLPKACTNFNSEQFLGINDAIRSIEVHDAAICRFYVDPGCGGGHFPIAIRGGNKIENLNAIPSFGLDRSISSYSCE